MSRFSIFVIVALFLSSVLFSGCIYVKVRTPLDTDVSQTRLGEKVGKSDAYCIAWLFAWGDASTEAAASDGEIETINHLDSEYKIILFGLYSRRTTIAYGD